MAIVGKGCILVALAALKTQYIDIRSQVMKYGLVLAGLVAGGLCAALLLDEKRGPKRRKLLKKRANQIWDEAAHKWSDYSRELKPHLEKYSKDLSEGAKRVSEGTLQRIEETTQNGWSPSARMLGATASAIAFYGAGRGGLIGILLRTISLGLLARALVASK
jgi:gas vesicle protein